MSSTISDLPDWVSVPLSSLGPTVNDQGYYVGRVGLGSGNYSR